MKILLFTLLTITPGLLFSQTDKERLDSIIIAHTSTRFFECLQFERQEKNVIWDNEQMAERWKSNPEDNTVIEKTVQTYIYGLRTKAGESFYYRKSGRNSEWTSCILRIEVDSVGKIMDLGLLKQLDVVKAINDLEIIEKALAIELARPHLKNKRVKAPNCELIYDLDTNVVYWKIRSSSGLINVTERSVLINAIDKKYIRTEEFKYSRNI